MVPMRHATPPNERTRGFTLIELLLVVAIIAVLAAIAVPNFLEAQTRAKVSREKNDLRSQSLAMEAYYTDWNSYTRDSDSSLDIGYAPGPAAADPSNPLYTQCANGGFQLTTPIAYMTSLLFDPCSTAVRNGQGARGYRIGSGTWSYPSGSINPADDQGSSALFQSVGKRACYILIGVGPDGARCRNTYKCFPYMSGAEGGVGLDLAPNGQPKCYVDYDPTNGTCSLGDVYRFGGSWQSGRFMLNGAVVGEGASPGGGAW